MDPQTQALIQQLMGGSNQAMPNAQQFTPQATGYGQAMGAQYGTDQGMYSMPNAQAQQYLSGANMPYGMLTSGG